MRGILKSRNWWLKSLQARTVKLEMTYLFMLANPESWQITIGQNDTVWMKRAAMQKPRQSVWTWFTISFLRSGRRLLRDAERREEPSLVLQTMNPSFERAKSCSSFRCCKSVQVLVGWLRNARRGERKRGRDAKNRRWENRPYFRSHLLVSEANSRHSFSALTNNQQRITGYHPTFSTYALWLNQKKEIELGHWKRHETILYSWWSNHTKGLFHARNEYITDYLGCHRFSSLCT
jgi:hypothetical protein